jgi:hypothetical protein
MTSRDFCYWLQGYFEVARASKEPGEIAIDAAQAEMIQRHLSLVFKHEIDPSQGTPEHQAELQKIHDKIDEIASRPPLHGKSPVYRC